MNAPLAKVSVKEEFHRPSDSLARKLTAANLYVYSTLESVETIKRASNLSWAIGDSKSSIVWVM